MEALRSVLSIPIVQIILGVLVGLAAFKILVSILKDVVSILIAIAVGAAFIAILSAVTKVNMLGTISTFFNELKSIISLLLSGLSKIKLNF